MKITLTATVLAVAMSGAMAQVGNGAAPGRLEAAETAQLRAPATESIDIRSQVAIAGNLVACRLVGHVTLWASRFVRLVDDVRGDIGGVEAGLGQFGASTRLEDCGIARADVDVSERFVNFIVAAESLAARAEAESPTTVASRLADGRYHFADNDGTQIPLVQRATGPIVTDSGALTVVLVRGASDPLLKTAPSFAAAARAAISPIAIRPNPDGSRFGLD